MLDTVILLLLLILLLAAAFFVAPEALRALARRNRRRRAAVNAALLALERGLRESAEALHPYARLRARPYRRVFEPARGHMHGAAREHTRALSLLRMLVLPQVAGGAWAFAHFLDHPHHLVAIPRDSARLTEIERRVRRASAALAAARADMTGLRRVPAELELEGKRLVKETLPRLARALDAEREAGLQPLDLAERLAGLERQAAALVARLASAHEGPAPAAPEPARRESAAEKAPPADDEAAPTAPEVPALGTEAERFGGDAARTPRQSDALARQLEGVESAAAALARDLEAVSEARQALDARLAAVAELWESLPLPERAGVADEQLPPAEGEPAPDEAPALPYNGALLARAETMLDAAGEWRARLGFARASRLADSAGLLLQLAAELAGAARHAELLARAEEPLEPDAIAAVQAELAELVAAARSIAVTATPAEAREALAEEGEAEAAALRQRARSLATRARRLHGQHEAAVESLEGRAAAAHNALSRALARLSRRLAVSPHEPLVARTQALERTYAAATGRPVRLQAYAQAAEALAAELQEWTERLSAGLEALSGQRDALRRRIDEAHRLAGGWRSLRPYLETMQSCAAELWQIDPASEAAAGGGATLEEIDAALAEAGALAREAAAAFEALVAVRRRLAALEARLAEATDAEEEEEISAWEGARRPAQKPPSPTLAAARSAQTVEEAVAILEAAL